MANVVFVQNSFYEKIGVMEISAVLKAHGHKCRVIIEDNDRKGFLEEVAAAQPDVIGFSLLLTEQKWVREIAAALKPAGIRAFVIAGGPHPTFFPQFIETEGIDAIAIGEGEYAMLDLANALDRQEPVDGILNLVIKRDGKIRRNPLRQMADLDELPLPDRDLYLTYDYFRTKDSQDFTVSRGCPYQCAYCFFHKWNELYADTPNRRIIRLKSVDRCMKEIKETAARVKLPLVSYVDSSFTLDKAWTLEFLEAYRQQIDIPFTFNLRPNLVDEEIVTAIAATGRCRMIRMGIEVGNERYRREVLKKDVTNEQIYHAGALLKKHGIKLMTYNMYCLPGETPDMAVETIEMNHRLAPAAISSMIFHPYPGLELTEYALRNNFLKEENIQKIELREYKWFRSVMTQPRIREVQNLCLLSRVGARHPRLIPTIRTLSRLPSNKIFDLIALAGLVEMAREYYDISTFRVFQQHVFGDKSKMS